MEEDIDEFGEYIGDEYSNSDLESAAEDSVDDRSEEDVKYIHATHDTQDISEPLVKPHKRVVSNLVTPTFTDYILDLMKDAPGLVRNFAIVGHTYHGKTSLMQWLAEETMMDPQPQFTRTTLETQRKLTLKPQFECLLMRSSLGKSYVFNVADTPGHPDFRLERQGAQSICDFNLYVVDAIEGPLNTTICESKPRIVVINKVDRLFLDQRLPASNAFDRLNVIAQNLNTSLNDIVFVSAKFKFAFTIESMRKLYAKYQKLSALNFATKQNFTKFILEPMAKLFGCGLVGLSTAEPLQRSLGIQLCNKEWALNSDDRLRLIFARYFESGISPLVDCIVSQNAPQSCVEKSDAFKFEHEGEIYSVCRAPRGDPAGERDPIHVDFFLPYGNKKIPVGNGVPPGSWYITRNFSSNSPPEPARDSVMKFVLEPVKPTNEEFRELLGGLNKIKPIFPAFDFNVSVEGTFEVYGPGELYIDTCLATLKRNHQFNVGNPSVVFRETVTAESYAAFPTKIPGHPGNSITVIAQPFFTDKDEETNVWYTDSDANNQLIAYNGCGVSPEIKSALIEGFKCFVDMGPVVEGLVTNTTIKITELKIDEFSYLLTSLMQRACCAASLLAEPRLVEPQYKFTVIGGLDVGRACYSEIAKRDGSVVLDEPIVGTTLYKTEAVIPVIDSLGLQLDILCQLESKNQGQVFCELDGWVKVEGDPLDTSIKVPRLNVASPSARARDFMIKTRKTKGLSLEPQIDRYVDEEVRQLIS